MLIGLNGVSSSLDTVSAELNASFIFIDKNALIRASGSWYVSFSWAYPVRLQLLRILLHWCARLSSCLILEEASFYFLKELLFGNCPKFHNAIWKCTWMTRSWNVAGSQVPHTLQEGLPRNVLADCVWISAQGHEQWLQCWEACRARWNSRPHVLFRRVERLSFTWKASVDGSRAGAQSLSPHRWVYLVLICLCFTSHKA